MPQKPTIFFSHSSRDKQPLVKLKDLFVAKTGGTVDVFLSSDGQSIKLGRNWVHRVEEGLDEAKLMISFITANSLESDWLYFETGYAYAKGIRVVPVGFLGADLKELRPPLSLLQGFNITSHDGLDNIVALVNDEFNYSHSGKFSVEDYQHIVAAAEQDSVPLFGPATYVIDHVMLWVRDLKYTSIAEAIKRTKEVLLTHNVKLYHSPDTSRVNIHGGTLRFAGPSRKGDVLERIDITLDPLIARVMLPVVCQLLNELRQEGLQGLSFLITFADSIHATTDMRKMSSRLFACGVELIGEETLSYKGVSFSFLPRGTHNPETLSVQLPENDLPVNIIVELVNQMFERGVLVEIERFGPPILD